jgi:hypothetical protein
MNLDDLFHLMGRAKLAKVAAKHFACERFACGRFGRPAQTTQGHFWFRHQVEPAR